MVSVLLLFLIVCGDAQFSHLIQSIVEPVGALRYMDMTENGEILAVRDNENLFLYSNNGSLFQKKQEFDLGCTMCAVDITADGEWMLVVQKSSPFHVYRYDHTLDQYQLFQEIQINEKTSRGGAMTDDHQWLVLPKNNERVHIYTFDGTKFVHFQTLHTEF